MTHLAQGGILPSLGFFGATASDCLALRLPAPPSEVEVRLESDAPGFLNLCGLGFFKDDHALALDPAGFSVECSSIHDASGDADPVSLLSMRGFHSAQEANPRWRIRLRAPLDADEVRIYNRDDPWGCRSARVAVDMVDGDGRRIALHRGCSREAEASALTALASAVGPLPKLPADADESMLAHWRGHVLVRVADRLREEPGALAGVDWPQVIQLVDFWTPRVPSDEDLMLVAGYLAAQRLKQHATSVRAFSAILGSRQTLDRLNEAFGVLARAAGTDPLLVTRHGLSVVDKLARRRNEVLQHLTEVLEMLEARGGRPVLAYGTLLGAVRAEAFIAHDDDVDVLFCSPAGNREAVEADMAALRREFLASGYTRVDGVPGSLNLHVFHPSSEVMVDVFASWEEAGGLRLHMESMEIRSVAPGMFHPRSAVRLYGRAFPAPGAAEGFLRERYGPDWARPDPYFEWPWPLCDEDA